MCCATRSTRPQGVDLDTCEAFSRAVEQKLDQADPIENSYRLEVQSAGLDRALKRPSDFERFLGARVEVGLYAPLGGSVEQAASLHFSVCDAPMPAAVKHFEARLEGYEPGLLTLTDDAGASFFAASGRRRVGAAGRGMVGRL